MGTLGAGGGLAGFAEDGSAEQMAVNVAVMPLAIFVSVVVWMFISTKFYNSPIRLNDTFGLNHGKLTTSLAVGLAGGIVILLVAPLLSLITSMIIESFGETPQGQKLVSVIAEQTQSEEGVFFLIFFTFMAVVVAPIGEEILFRGILYPSIKQNGYPKVAAIGTAILFGLFHLNLLTFLSLTFVGLALVFIYEKTNNLLAPILAHALFNGVNVLLILATNFPEPAVTQ